MAWINEVVGEILNPPPPTNEQKVKNFLNTFGCIAQLCVVLTCILAVGAGIGIWIYRTYHG